jgi:hypothetical protein
MTNRNLKLIAFYFSAYADYRAWCKVKGTVPAALDLFVRAMELKLRNLEMMKGEGAAHETADKVVKP